MVAQAANTYPQPQYSDAAPAVLRHFSSLPCFNAPRSNAIRASCKLLQTWADAIIAYWRSYSSNNEIDINEPLYVLDLDACDGETAWRMQQALATRIEQQELPFSLCYLACYDDPGQATAMSTHAYFQDAISTGAIDFAYWNATHDELHLLHQKRPIKVSANPVAILALGYFHKLPGELFGVHNGELIQGFVSSEIINASDRSSSANDAPPLHTFSYTWQTCAATAPALLAPVLVYYQRFCNGSAVQVPLAACLRLDGINRLSRGRTLLLAADQGVSNAQQIRLGALSPPSVWHAEAAPMPVNFHALSLHQQHTGASTWQQQLDDDGIVLHSAWRDDQQAILAADFRAHCTLLAQAHPDDIEHLLAMRHDPADSLTLLRLSHFDPQFLDNCIEALLNTPLDLNDRLRHAWRHALERVFCVFFPHRDNDGFYYRLGLLALQFDHLGLASDCFRKQLDCYGEDADTLYLLSWCDSLRGATADAAAMLAHVLTIAPDHLPAQQLSDVLTARLARWHQHRWYLPQNGQESRLQLEPIGQEHAAELLTQYRDRQIGIMAALPQLDSLSEAAAWIDQEQQDSTRATFAVMHADWGLIGIVSMYCSGNAGYFYFWIGSDYQDQGWGREAATCLIAMMQQRGVTEVFTAVYDDNLRSVHTLQRLGFDVFDTPASTSQDQQHYFHLSSLARLPGSRLEDGAQLAALRRLCNAIDIPLPF